MKNDKVSKESEDLVAGNIGWIKRLFPEAVSEGKINFGKLKMALGQELDNKEESYSFNWAGRRDAFKNIQSTAKGTLVPDENASINFKETKNLFIEGDNLEVLKLLQKSYFNQVKMIYIDPPYNTGHDFVYRDNFKNGIKAYLEQTGQLNESGAILSTNPETSGRFHSDWISMMYPRLFLARNLLKDDGVIFISIDDNEVHNLKYIMNEVFGEECFIAQLVVQLNPRGRTLDKYIAKTHEYILVYSKEGAEGSVTELTKSEEKLAEYDEEDKNGKYRELELRNRNPVFSRKNRPNLFYPMYADQRTGSVSLEKSKDFGTEIFPMNSKNEEGCWTWGREKARENVNLLTAKKVSTGAWRVYRKDYANKENGEIATTKAKSIWLESNINNENGKETLRKLFDGVSPFDFPKSVDLIKKCILIGSNKENDIILDFFAGSGTTAQAVLEQNVNDGGTRKFILVQMPEPTPEKSEAKKAGYNTVADVCGERIRRVIKNLKNGERNKLTKSNADIGFKVFKLEKSNYKIWENYDGQDVKELTKQLGLFKSTLINDYKDVNVIYECVIKEGLNLNSQIELLDIKGDKIYKVSDNIQSFYICLDDEIKKESLDKLELKKDDLLICLDNALDDSKKTNISLQCKLKTV